MCKKNDNLIDVPIEDAKYYLVSMTYKDEKTGKDTIGNIRVINNKFVFEGDAKQSAKVFFDVILKKQVDGYLKVRAEYTEKPYIKEIKEDCHTADKEYNQANAECIAMELLASLGYNKFVEEYSRIAWYA